MTSIKWNLLTGKIKILRQEPHFESQNNVADYLVNTTQN